MSEAEEAPFDWSTLVPRIVHPMKVTVIEAMIWINCPLSATDLVRAFDGEFGLSHVSYHLTSLAKVGVLEKVSQRQVRGTTENFFYFARRL